MASRQPDQDRGGQPNYSDCLPGEALQRSDGCVREILRERLCEDPEIDAGDVAVSVAGGKITLEGTVDNMLTRIAVEDVAEQFGAQDVENNLRVADKVE